MDDHIGDYSYEDKPMAKRLDIQIIVKYCITIIKIRNYNLGLQTNF